MRKYAVYCGRNFNQRKEEIRNHLLSKVVKNKAATISKKKKETIVQDIISKKDDLPDKVTQKKNKIKSNLEEEKQKLNADSKKNKSSAKLDLVSKAEDSKSGRVTRNATKNVAKNAPQVISKKNKNTDKVAVGLKQKKVKSTLISKKNNKAIKKQVVSKEEKNETEAVFEKTQKKTKQIPALKEEKIVPKGLSKKKKSYLKKVLVPKEEKNATEVVSKKNKQKSKVPAVPNKDKNESKTISTKAKRKAESDLQKENTRPVVATKKAKVLKDVTTIKKKDIIEEPILIKEGKNSKDLVTKKKVKVTKDPLKRTNLENSVKALLKVVDVGEQKRRTLFTSEKPPLFLIITSVKVPKTPLHQVRFELPHTFVTPTDDIALFVKDVKRGRRRSFDDTIHHYEDLLQKHGYNRIKSVIPINQVKTEYRQFEMRRRLLGSYDHFLCDGRISGHLAHLLGKTFREHRKLPISIHMDKKDLKTEIDRALQKTSMQIHSNGDTYVTQFATCSMSVDEITDNLLSVIQQLHKDFPGGWKNVRSLRIKSPLSVAIPVYMTLKNKNEVEVPVIEPKRPKAYKSVEGELSTFTANVHVTVAPDGTVDVRRLGGESDDDEENLDEIEEEDGENEDAENKVKDEEDDDEDEDDEDEDDEDENDEDV